MSLLRACLLVLGLAAATPALASDWGFSVGIGPRYSYPYHGGGYYYSPYRYYSSPYYSSYYYSSPYYYSRPYYYSSPYSFNFGYYPRYHRRYHWRH